MGCATDRGSGARVIDYAGGKAAPIEARPHLLANQECPHYAVPVWSPPRFVPSASPSATTSGFMNQECSGLDDTSKPCERMASATMGPTAAMIVRDKARRTSGVGCWVISR